MGLVSLALYGVIDTFILLNCMVASDSDLVWWLKINSVFLGTVILDR